MADFIPVHSDMYKEHDSYTTLFLKRLVGNIEANKVNSKSNIVNYFESSGNNNTDKFYERPFTSVGRYRSFFSCPVFVEPTLKEIDISIYCRISNGLLDDTASDDLLRNNVRFTAQFDNDFNTGARSGTKAPPFTNEEWGWVNFTYTLGDTFRKSLSQSGAFKRLMLGMLSEGVLNMLPGNPSQFYDDTEDGIMSSWEDVSAADSTSNKIDTGPSFYSNVAGGNPPNSEANNEITMSVIRKSLNPNHIVGFYQHMQVPTPFNDAMYVVPAHILALSDERITESNNQVAKYYIPYAQFRAIQIKEVHE